MSTPLTAEALADALDVFFADGIAGVAERLRENARRLARDAVPEPPPIAAVPDALYVWANADASGDTGYDAARRHVREMLKIRQPAMGQVVNVAKVQAVIDWIESNREYVTGAEKLITELTAAIEPQASSHVG